MTLNVKTLTRRLHAFCAANLTAEHVLEGAGWYAQAQMECQLVSCGTKKDIAVVVGIVAALSPAQRWERNIEEARRCIQGFEGNLGTYPAQAAKARAIRDGALILETLKGRKTQDFYKAIIAKGDTRVVVVDRHAARACGIDAKGGLSEAQYSAIAEAYSRATPDGLTPCQHQAAVWLAVREACL